MFSVGFFRRISKSQLHNPLLFTTQYRLNDLSLKKRPFENIEEKKNKMLVTSIFFFSLNVFYLIQDKFCDLDHF